ncbi:neuropilin nrp and tolloid tll [Echinococcus multilocularis]|uniref:Neuropilin nrp and tolloid tll n=1 Tax=Echinococcus multilocularis TaxID=6211 RepID=A0A068YE14_ECHMU|nr:neuropilin nrp and tolloid tll [Echinococcus multilocularis]
MNSSKLQVLSWTLLVVFTSRTFSNLTNTTVTPTNNTISSILNRHRRVVSTAGVGDLPPQSEICKEFVESKVVLKGAKAASPADIFNNLSIGKDFAMTGRKYAKNYVFQSPNYPRKYPKNIDCFKLIVAPSQDHRIFLQISQPFALEPDSLCTTDFLEVRDGAFGFSPLIGRFCSRLPPPENEEIRSTSRYLWLRFRSDNTLPHDGFRAIFYFQKAGDRHDEYRDPHPKILRRFNVIQLNEDEQWTMRSEFLTKQLDYVSTEERRLPLEAVFDIRSPPGTHILMHVHHFQVPLMAAWSCNPDFLLKQKAVKYCDYHSGSGSVRTDFFTEKSSNIVQVRQFTPSIPDPASYIDGTHTFLEIYTDGMTISEASPPCPRVDRFCIASVHTDLSDASGSPSSSSSASSSGSSSSSDKNVGDGYVRRQFLVPSPRLVARLIVAKPSRPILTTTENGPVGVLEDGVDPFEMAKTLDIFSMLPNFTFTLTTLSPLVNGVCAPNQRACDEAYCIQTSHWCDGVINCPLGQDEGDAACNPEKAGVVENVEETDTTGLSEKDKAALERAMEEKADLEKHGAIIGSIALTLIVTTIICMFFAIRRKRKEATHHVIEVKLPYNLDRPHLSGANANNGTKNIASTSLHPSKLPSENVIIDLEDVENEPVFSSSGDALLGREPSSAQKGILGPTGIFANHNRDRKTSPAMSKAFGLSANSKSPSAKPGKPRNALFRHQQLQQQQKSQRGAWQSDVNLIQRSQIQNSRGKLNRGNSAQTADEVANFRYIQPQLPPRVTNPPPVAAKNRQPWNHRQQQQREEQHRRSQNGRHHHHHHHRHRQHHHHRHRQQQQQPSDKERHQPPQSVLLLQQKTYSTDVPDSSCQESHVLNCRMLTEQQRTLSLATSRFRLYDSRELTLYGDGFSSSGSASRSSSSLSSSSASTSRSTSSTGSPSTSCSSKSTTTTSFCPQKRVPREYRGYENLVPYSIRLKTFCSMPDVTRAVGPPAIVPGGGVGSGGYRFAVSCGHKDCRDYYRLQALRSDLQTEWRRPERVGAEKPALFKEREIEITPSSEDGEEEEEEVGVRNDNSGEGGNSGETSISLSKLIASDAYSVHGLSDAISVESSKDGVSGSEATHSAVTEESDGSARQSSYTSTNSPISLRAPSRISSVKRSLLRVTSMSKRLGSPASSRSRVRVHPTAPNLLVYEYEA